MSSLFTYSIGWPGIPVENVYAGLFVKAGNFTNKTNTFTAETLAEAAGKNVLLFGSYFTEDSVAALVAVTAGVTNVYYETPAPKTVYTGATQVPYEDFFAPLGANALFAPLLRFHAGKGSTGDEAVWRGLLAQADAANLPLFNFLLTKEVSDFDDVSVLETSGKGIQAVDSARAQRAAAVCGYPITVNGCTAWLVLAPWEPVVPYRDAAIAEATKRGLDIGITMRQRIEPPFTAYSLGRTHDGVDMRFVYDKATFNGGGAPTAAGISREALLERPAPGTELLRTFLQKPLDA